MDKNSIALVSNKTPIFKIKIFHLYSQRRYNSSKLGYFSLCSIRSVRPNKFAHLKKRAKMKNIIIHSRQWSLRADTTKRKFFLNSVVILKKNFLPLSSYMLGAALLEVKRRKYISYFLDVY